MKASSKEGIKIIADKGNFLYEEWHKFVLSRQELVEDIPLLSHAHLAFKILIDTYETHIDFNPHTDMRSTLENFRENSQAVFKIIQNYKDKKDFDLTK